MRAVVLALAVAAACGVVVNGEFAAPRRDEALAWLQFLGKMGPHSGCVSEPGAAAATAFAFARWNADATVYHGTADSRWVGGNINAGSFYGITPIYATYHTTNEHYTTHGSCQYKDYHITALPQPAVRRYTFTATANAALPDVLYMPEMTMEPLKNYADRHDHELNGNGHHVLPVVALSDTDRQKSGNVQAAKVLSGRLAPKGVRGLIQRRALAPADVKSAATTYLAKKYNHNGALTEANYAGFNKAAPFDVNKVAPVFPGGNRYLAYDELIVTGRPAFVADDAINTASADTAINGLNAWADTCTAGVVATTYGVDYMSVVPFEHGPYDTDRADARAYEVMASIEQRGLAATLKDLHTLNDALMKLALKMCLSPQSLKQAHVLDQTEAASTIATLANRSKTQSLTTVEMQKLHAAATLLATHCAMGPDPKALAPPQPATGLHRQRVRQAKLQRLHRRD